MHLQEKKRNVNDKWTEGDNRKQKRHNGNKGTEHRKLQYQGDRKHVTKKEINRKEKKQV